jgi:hypothetical protein
MGFLPLYPATLLTSFRFRTNAALAQTSQGGIFAFDSLFMFF